MRKIYRVESGSMRAVVSATTLGGAIRKARARRQWKALSLLTRVQRWLPKSQAYGPWWYVATHKSITVPIEAIQRADQILQGRA